MRGGGERVLPGRDLVRSARLAADGEHGRVVRERHRAAAKRRVAQVYELSLAELVLVSVDGEEDASTQDEVELLVPVDLLRVLLHDPAARAGRVRVGAKRLDPEAAAHGAPDEAVAHLDRVELVDVRRVHERRSPNRGSSRSGSRSVSSRKYPAECPSVSSSRARRRCSNAASASPAWASQQPAL